MLAHHYDATFWMSKIYFISVQGGGAFYCKYFSQAYVYGKIGDLLAIDVLTEHNSYIGIIMMVSFLFGSESS